MAQEPPDTGFAGAPSIVADVAFVLVHVMDERSFDVSVQVGAGTEMVTVARQCEVKPLPVTVMS